MDPLDDDGRVRSKAKVRVGDAIPGTSPPQSPPLLPVEGLRRRVTTFLVRTQSPGPRSVDPRKPLVFPSTRGSRRDDILGSKRTFYPETPHTTSGLSPVGDPSRPLSLGVVDWCRGVVVRGFYVGSSGVTRRRTGLVLQGKSGVTKYKKNKTFRVKISPQNFLLTFGLGGKKKNRGQNDQETS